MLKHPTHPIYKSHVPTAHAHYMPAQGHNEYLVSLNTFFMEVHVHIPRGVHFPISVGISILDADISTDIVEPADLNRYVGCM